MQQLGSVQLISQSYPTLMKTEIPPHCMRLLWRLVVVSTRKVNCSGYFLKDTLPNHSPGFKLLGHKLCLSLVFSCTMKCVQPENRHKCDFYCHLCKKNIHPYIKSKNTQGKVQLKKELILKNSFCKQCKKSFTLYNFVF
uniref:Uncharacterized protein n=1 Tax=Anguilla anguilla TaxID=7936 RepID=A0A0E9X6T4_ANGAN